MIFESSLGLVRARWGVGVACDRDFFRKCGSKKLREQQPEDLCSAAETRGEPAEGARDSGLIRVGAGVGGHTACKDFDLDESELGSGGWDWAR